MPHARIPVEILRERFTGIPEKDRPKAIALYMTLVLTSAELLLDGHIPDLVLVASAHQIGLSRGRYGTRESHKIARSLCDIGLLERHNHDHYTITEWQVFHSGRVAVTDARKADAERKRRARQQPELPGIRADVRNGSPENVQPGHAADSRAHARRRQRQEEQVRGEGFLRAETALDQERAIPTRSLPVDKQREVLKLLDAIGTDAQDGDNGKPPTIAVLNSLAAELPVGSLAKVHESLVTKRPKPRDRAAYTVGALQAERDSRTSAATVQASVPHGSTRTT